MKMTFIFCSPDKNIFDASSIKLFMLCPRKWYYRHIKGYVPVRESVHLQGGRAVHKGAELAHKGETIAAEQAVLAECRGLEEHKVKTPQKMLQTYRNYKKFLETDTAKTLEYEDEDGKHCRAVEVKFTLPMPNNTIFTGCIDRVIIDSAGLIWIEDYKTTSKWNTHWWKNWSNSFSLLGYCYAAKRVTGECNGAQITQLYITSKDVRSTKELIAKPDVCREIVLNFTPEKYEEFENTYCDHVARIYSALQLKDPKYWPMCNHDFSCVHKYGKCVYYNLCVFGEEVYESEGLMKGDTERREQ